MVQKETLFQKTPKKMFIMSSKLLPAGKRPSAWKIAIVTQSSWIPPVETVGATKARIQSSSLDGASVGVFRCAVPGEYVERAVYLQSWPCGQITNT